MSIVAITTGAEFNAIRSALTLEYEQQNDISLAAYTNWTTLYSTLSGTGFSGSYGGQGFSISNLTSSQSGFESGLFGTMVSGTVENVILVSPTVTAGNVGLFFNWCLTGCVLRNCEVRGGTLSISGYGGSFWGYATAGALIQRCSSSLSISGAGTSGIAGIAGLMNDATSTTIIEDCVFNGALSVASDNRGQIVGRSTAATIRRCVAYGTGANAGPTPGTNVTAVFWDEDVASDQSGGIGTATSTADMKDIATYVNAGFDIGAL
jgi:hypothetical protein